jgi:hypothetical protein
MDTQDVLDLLANIGGVTLRKNKNERWASPKPAGYKLQWSIELTIAGYHDVGGMRQTLRASGETAKEAGEALYAALEAFLYGEAGKESRARYVKSHEVQQALWDKHPEARYGGNGFRVTHPGELLPEITL